MKAKRLAVWFVAAGLAVPALLALPTNSGTPDVDASPALAKADTSSVDGKVMRLFMDRVEILGTLAKPQAVYIVPGSDPKVDDIKLDRSFFEEIFRPIDKDMIKRSAVVKSDENVIPW